MAERVQASRSAQRRHPALCGRSFPCGVRTRVAPSTRYRRPPRHRRHQQCIPPVHTCRPPLGCMRPRYFCWPMAANLAAMAQRSSSCTQAREPCSRPQDSTSRRSTRSSSPPSSVSSYRGFFGTGSALCPHPCQTPVVTYVGGGRPPERANRMPRPPIGRTCRARSRHRQEPDGLELRPAAPCPGGASGSTADKGRLGCEANRRSILPTTRTTAPRPLRS